MGQSPKLKDSQAKLELFNVSSTNSRLRGLNVEEVGGRRDLRSLMSIATCLSLLSLSEK